MNRIFHARLPWHTRLLLVMLTAIVLWAFWVKLILPATVTLLLVVVLIERIIHTTYTVTTDGQLLIYHGRFSPTREIALTDIRRIEKVRSNNFGKWHLADFLVIYYGEEPEKSISLLPDKEMEFVEHIQKIRRL